ncbi:MULTISPECIES: 3-deoxy-7-phosphoheptulonate synthase [unclassified Streptomyces]|uniref:3-deoxy-7-phosphoheptulonate synthase n=1 Tax=unclassified Streptomyces TaxID=2593676 RepID=UPI0016612C31|nr:MULTISPECIES: 3-deoxy-7-phosphoheptulonate synthase [unclassified Streptomyces]MBD0711177.1 phospho-2-dehydro-3-deoxyheptonate aldolase [Streptomyces sp. CBMA291]MBD0714208.1 phospho-2-dehydro-3-deoxyheptonate aldolase [Streptomyces sp. CBMA370]
MDDALLDIRYEQALQQPPWEDEEQVLRVRKELAARPALVRAEDVRTLRTVLAKVAAGEAHVVQAGDCAEDTAECTPGYIARKAGLLNVLAGRLEMDTCRPVVRVGRLAGQFGKPRSNPTERVGDLELPVFRGHMVNSPEPDPAARRPDPLRLLSGYDAAHAAMGHLGWLDESGPHRIGAPVWTSHEALLLDYEVPMLRRQPDGRLLLTSTHFPWIGERTRQLDGAHVALLAEVVNPVACKVGPTMTPEALTALCERLDPAREAGRLTLIARMGAGAAAERLPALVAAVRAAGHPVVWLTDPMHGNTVNTPSGLKSRFLETIAREIDEFQHAVAAGGGIAGGLHLETTPDDVTECVLDSTQVDLVGTRYTSCCDPRLNPEQALVAASAWWTAGGSTRPAAA